MTNYNKTILKCSDLRRFSEIMKGISFRNSQILFYDDENEASIESLDYLPLEDIRQLSTRYPDLCFIAQYFLAVEEYHTIYTVKFRNGISIDMGIKANYNIVSFKEWDRILGETYHNLFDRAIKMLSCIDIVKKNKKGENYIDFVKEITFDTDDGEFLMRVSKKYSDLEIVCYLMHGERLIEVPWIDDSFPF